MGGRAGTMDSNQITHSTAQYRTGTDRQGSLYSYRMCCTVLCTYTDRKNCTVVGLVAIINPQIKECAKATTQHNIPTPYATHVCCCLNSSASTFILIITSILTYDIIPFVGQIRKILELIAATTTVD